MKHYQTDVAVIGAGLAGIVTALELLDCGYSVALLDGSPDGALGGQANDAFGGMLLTGTAEQARNRIKDSPELLLEDWLRASEFQAGDCWPKAWAELYAEQCTPMIYQWLIAHGIRFFPSVQWVERGLHGNGNSLPRYHIAWGCGRGIASTLADALTQHAKAANLQILRGHRVESFEQNAKGISGCMGVTDYYLTDTNTNSEQHQFTVTANNTVVCSGGINGNLEKVRQNWDTCYGPPPPNLLAGSSPDADGEMHDQVQSLGGQITHLNHMWNYAAGVAHPKGRFPEHGLSLIPARSALWLDCHGRRIGPMPLVTGFDTHDLCKTVGNLPGQYSWQVMNYRIAVRELAASGTDANPDFRDKKLLRIIWKALRGGDPTLTDWLIKKCPDVISAENPTELVNRMNALTGGNDIDRNGMLADIRAYDANIARGKKLHNDDQIRRLQQLRQWPPDRMRTCNMQPILDPKAGPLIAIRERLISRKSLGGIQTDTCSRVLSTNGNPIPGLYAAGEAAGFGGGGISGIRSLEGTFLSNCILNGRIAAQSIAGKI